VAENLTLEAVRTLLRGYVRPTRGGRKVREAEHRCRGAATSVQEITSRNTQHRDDLGGVPVPSLADRHRYAPNADAASEQSVELPRSSQPVDTELSRRSTQMDEADFANNVHQLEDVAATLALIAERPSMVLSGGPTAHALDQAERALTQIRSVLTRAACAQSVFTSKQYLLADTDFHDLLVLLLGQRSGIVTVQYGQHLDTTLHLVCFLMPRKGTNGHGVSTQPSDVFIAISGAGHGMLPLIEGIPIERVRNSMGLPLEAAAAVAALISDLAHARTAMY
jgi:hypothetical protein